MWLNCWLVYIVAGPLIINFFSSLVRLLFDDFTEFPDNRNCYSYIETDGNDTQNQQTKDPRHNKQEFDSVSGRDCPYPDCSSNWKQTEKRRQESCLLRGYADRLMRNVVLIQWNTKCSVMSRSNTLRTVCPRKGQITLSDLSEESAFSQQRRRSQDKLHYNIIAKRKIYMQDQNNSSTLAAGFCASIFTKYCINWTNLDFYKQALCILKSQKYYPRYNSWVSSLLTVPVVWFEHLFSDNKPFK